MEEGEEWKNPRFGYVGMPNPVPSPLGSGSGENGDDSGEGRRSSGRPDSDPSIYDQFPAPPVDDRFAYARSAAGVVGGVYGVGSSPNSNSMRVSGRYTPGVALSTITEASPASSQKSAGSLVAGASVFSSEGSDSPRGLGLKISRSESGGGSGGSNPAASTVPGLSQRSLHRTLRVPLRSSSLSNVESHSVSKSGPYPAYF